MSAVAEDQKPGRNTLDRAPGRALTFLLGAGRSPRLRGLLETRGYADDEHARGWQLLRAVDPSLAANDGGLGDGADPAVRDAIASLDGWDNLNLPIVDAALRRREPEVHGFLFAGGLAPADGIESVRVVTTFIDRVDTVRAVAENQREEAPFGAPQAKRALTLMESRGVGEAEQETVRGWLEVAQRGAAPVAPKVEVDDDEALVALHEWVSEWSLVARKLLKRKVDLIALGLAEKKARAEKAKDPPKPA